jgi:hypothetical protein
MAKNPSARKRKRVTAGRGSVKPQTVFVAMFDVLGFRTVVARTPLPLLRDTYRRLQREKQWAARIPVLGRSGVQDWVVPTTIFSDTILMWADDSYEALDTLLATCSILIGNTVMMGWPVRGGIAYGQCVLDRRRRMFVGQPIVDAHETQESQEWVGAALHHSCLSHQSLSTVMQKHDSVRSYAVPVKPGAPGLDWAIHWGDRIPDAQAAIAQLSQGVGPSVRTKYDNTQAFLSAVL